MAEEQNALFRTARSVYRTVSPVLEWFDVFSDFARHELTYGPAVDVSLGRRLWLWRHGFNSRAYVLQDLSQWDPSQFVSSWEFCRTQEINVPWSYVIENKLSFHLLMGQFPDHRPVVFGMLDGGRIKPVGRRNIKDGPVGEWVASLLREHGSLVLKPVHGYGGDGVHILTWLDGGPLLDGERNSAEEFATFVAGLDDYLVVERIQQAEYAARIFPEATNTIRIYTMYDEEAGEPFVPAASHRFGTVASAPVDNFSRNGLAALIDVDTGRLGPGAWLADPNDLRRDERHPDTGEHIAGTTVPAWSAVTEGILEMATMFSQAPFLGWDVVVDEDEGYYVIEANAAPGITTVQMHRPMKTDPRVVRFLERYGI